MAKIADIKGNHLLVSVGFQVQEDYVSDFAFDIDGIIGISNDEWGSKFFLFHLVAFHQFPMNETGIGSTIH